MVKQNKSLKPIVKKSAMSGSIKPSVLSQHFTLKTKTSNLIKSNFFKNRSRRTKLPTFPRDFKRVWHAVSPYRIGFKPFDFYYPFLSLLPYPFPTYNTYFRLQSRTFIFWYEFAKRKYNITFDFGIKQKKTASETAVWFRTTRRGASPFYSWWSHWRRLSSFRLANNSKFLNLNSNAKQPFFSLKTDSGLLWFEESLPQVRRSAWNFYSRLTTIRSGLFSLSQSIFDQKIFSRRAPLDSTTFWLASPIHDYSAFVKTYSANKTMVLPERFFQFRREREYLSQYWSQSSYRLWSSFNNTATLSLNFILPKLLFYGKTRVSLLLFSSFIFMQPVLVSFWQVFSSKLLTNRYFSGAETGRTANSHWYSRILPVPSRRSKSKVRFRAISFFVRKAFFLRHLRRKLFRRPKTLSFSLSLSDRVRRLNSFFALLFQSYSFDSPIQYHQLFYLFSWIFYNEWFASTLVGRYLTLRPNHRFHQKPKKKWKFRRRSLAKAIAALEVSPPRARLGRGQDKKGNKPFRAKRSGRPYDKRNRNKAIKI